MREVEILVQLQSDFPEAREVLSQFTFHGEKQTVDYYYYDPLRKNLQLTAGNKLMECCRIREKNGKAFIAYKVDVYNGEVWSHSDEHETEVNCAHTAREIFRNLGLQPLVTVHNNKHTFSTDKFEIVLEEVKDLGTFLEVEYKSDDGQLSVEEMKQEIAHFITDIGFKVSPALNSGKPELLLINSLKN